MLTRDGDKFRISILMNFETDERLPKHKKERRDEDDPMDSDSKSAFSPMRRSTFQVGTPWTGDVLSVNSNSAVHGEVSALTFFERIMAYWGYIKKPHIIEVIPKEEPKPTKTADLVFECVVDNDEQIKDIGAKIDKFKAMIEQAYALGQQALVEELTKKWKVYCYEAQLVASQMIKVISEDKMIEFVSGCEKGLRLDWIKNFTRMIPSDLGKKKLEIDRLEIFDNYVILHYDPENKNNKWTKEEIERELAKRRDPILFGVIRDSNKLYYIGDWKDEYCDLTWEDIAGKIDEKCLKLE